MRLVGIVAFIVSLIVPGNGICQHREDYIWQLGKSSDANIDDFPQSIQVNFNNSQLTSDTFYRPFYMGYFNTSISNGIGELLLYTNGCQVMSANHENIPGSNPLNPGIVDLEWCVGAKLGYPVFEGGLFLSFSNDSCILLLHQRLIIESHPTGLSVDTLFYSEFIKSNDEYVLSKKSVPICGGKLLQGNLEAFKSEDGHGWWVIQQVEDSNIYVTIKVDSCKIDTVFTQEIGTKISATDIAQSVFSPNGLKYARFGSKNQLFLFDFNRTNGHLSNFQEIHISDEGQYAGIAFSPNNRFLYVCNSTDVFQLDLFSENIENSKILLGQYDGFLDPFPTRFNLMQLGPDCRIYIGSTNGVKSMHLIKEPDLLGLESEFEQHAFHFPVNNSITIPNFPNFRYDTTFPCDPNITNFLSQYYNPMSEAVIFPIPTHDDINIQLSEEWMNEKVISFEVSNISGQLIFSNYLTKSMDPQKFSLPYLLPGVYFIFIKSTTKWYSKRIVFY